VLRRLKLGRMLDTLPELIRSCDLSIFRTMGPPCFRSMPPRGPITDAR